MDVNGNTCKMVNIYLSTRYERFWHWLQSALIVILLVTGFEANGLYTRVQSAIGMPEVGAALLLGILYFTLVGMAGAHYGERVVLPGNQLTAAEVRGAQVYALKNCAYCQQVLGHRGRREGPDMAVVRQRNRSPEWIQRFILNARLYQPGTTMPKYEIPLEDLEALSAYPLSLDPTRRVFQPVDREILLNWLGAPAGSWEKKIK